jgi:uncharacterized protein
MAAAPESLPAAAVMAKVPGSGPAKSRLQPALGAEMATELYRCFLLDRLDAIAALHDVAGVVAYTPAEAEPVMQTLAPVGLRLVAQRGADLGERLANVLGDLLARGHAAALAVDSDSPTLPMEYVRTAAAVLTTAAADVVVGPCDDGGYYLIGVRTRQPGLFQGIPWSTDRVLTLTLARARDLGLRVHLLPTWFDVDTEVDLRRLHAEMMTHGGPSRTYAFVKDLYK